MKMRKEGEKVGASEKLNESCVSCCNSFPTFLPSCIFSSCCRVTQNNRMIESSIPMMESFPSAPSNSLSLTIFDTRRRRGVGKIEWKES